MKFDFEKISYSEIVANFNPNNYKKIVFDHQRNPKQEPIPICLYVNTANQFIIKPSHKFYEYDGKVSIAKPRLFVSLYDYETIVQCNNNAIYCYHINDEELSLKYVPNKVKYADYTDFDEWLAACIDYLHRRTQKAKNKADEKRANLKTNAELNFIGVREDTADLMTNNGYKQSESYASYIAEYTDTFKKNGTKVVVSRNTRGTATVTVNNIDPSKLVEFLKSVEACRQKTAKENKPN